MANKNTIRVSEFEKLYYDDSRPFKEKHWNALCQYQEQQSKSEHTRKEYYRILNKGIQFTNYVGVIQAGNLTIEILPKTDRATTTAANLTINDLEKSDDLVSTNKQNWHNVLLQMLRECSLLRVNHVDYARLSLRSNSILDAYLELFLAETESLLHEGLIKKYRKKEGNQLALKGQLMFSKNLSENLVHSERFFVRHTEYNMSNIFNQLLYKTLRIIPTISNNPLLTDKVNRLLLDFPEMPNCNVTTSTFDNMVYDRKTDRYREALIISKMLLLNYRPDISGGSENVIAILFDMNKLWEEFVFRRLAKAAIPFSGISVKRQEKANFWWNSVEKKHKTIKPDIVIKKDNKKIILDTKWKIVDDNKPSDEDLKQMFVYNLLWNAEESFLLYPGGWEKCKGSYLHFEMSQKLKEENDIGEYCNHCSLMFLNVIDKEGKLISLEPFTAFLVGLL